MNYKTKLNEIVLKMNQLEDQMAQLRTELTTVASIVPEITVTDEAHLSATLKYEPMTHDNTATWVHIQDLPEPILVKWGQRLWLDKKTTFSYQNKETMSSELTEKGYKAVDWWLMYASDYIQSIICNPSDVDRYRSLLIYEHNRGSVASKKYMKKYFDWLQEEIVKYENS